MSSLIKLSSILLLVLSFTISAETKDYEILKEETKASGDSTKKRSGMLIVRLKTDLDKVRLLSIAKEIRAKKTEYHKLWISYYLPNMSLEHGSWARSHFTPKLDLRITGASIKDIEELSKKSIPNMVGKWLDNTPSTESLTIIYKDKEEYKLKVLYIEKRDEKRVDDLFSDLFADKVVKKSEYKDRPKYEKKVEGSQDFYVIEKNGNLGLYDSEGKFKELKLVKD